MRLKKVALLSDVTMNLVVKQLEKSSFVDSIKYSYGNIVTLLFQEEDLLKSTDLLVIHSDCYFHHYTLPEIKALHDAIFHFSSSYDGIILMSNYLLYNTSISLKESKGKYNISLPSLELYSNIFYFDFIQVLIEIGLENAYNFTTGHLYQMPYTKIAINELSNKIKQFIHFLSIPEKKVIVADCDNTLWGGILGEDGIENIQCDRNTHGILYLHFQQFLKQKKEEGFLLCLCSKNNFMDVEQVFIEKNMPTLWDDFIIKKINWKPKYKNIQAIAKELNLGLEAFIFIDDSNFEINSINEILPEVTSIKFENSYSNLLSLQDNICFKRKIILKSDVEKTKKYEEENKRNELKNKAYSFDNYIESLEIKNKLLVNLDSDLARLSQMTEKTNQFNFNKEIFNVHQLETFIANGNYVFSYQSADKFGDYGIIGLILVEKDKKNDSWFIRNFLMSCRALGRGIEDSFYQEVIKVLKKDEYIISDIIFKETLKNELALNFYKKIKKQL